MRVVMEGASSAGQKSGPHDCCTINHAGIIITTHDKLAHYLGMLTHQVGRAVKPSSQCCVVHFEVKSWNLNRQCCCRQHRRCWGSGRTDAEPDGALRAMQLVLMQVPIESQFTAGLVDHLNAEIVLGTVSACCAC